MKNNTYNDDLNRMMIMIFQDGENQIKNDIEANSNAFQRFYTRNLFYKALELIQKEKLR